MSAEATLPMRRRPRTSVTGASTKLSRMAIERDEHFPTEVKPCNNGDANNDCVCSFSAPPEIRAGTAERVSSLRPVDIRHTFYLSEPRTRDHRHKIAPEGTLTFLISRDGPSEVSAGFRIAGYWALRRTRDPPLNYDGRGRLSFNLSAFAPELAASGPVMPLPGWVAAGGSLAGKDISNALESCWSSLFLDLRCYSALAIVHPNRSQMRTSADQPAIGRSSLTHPPTVAM
jgi:hypothetical protein